MGVRHLYVLKNSAEDLNRDSAVLEGGKRFKRPTLGLRLVG